MTFPGSLTCFVLPCGRFVDLYLPECTNIFIVCCTSRICEAFFSLLYVCSWSPSPPLSLLGPLAAVLRYLRSDKRMSSVTFNNLALADGQQHRLLFHLKGMQQQGPGGVELHLDCRLVETVRDLPAAFQGLPAGYGLVELRTMQSRDQVTFDSQRFHTVLDVRTDG